jgi:hypothetical protein
MGQCEQALSRYANDQPAMARELWGCLVGACENIVSHVESWPKTSERWKIIRRILLRASKDPLPASDDPDAKDEGWPTWGWPAPRLDAACGLPFFACRVGQADKIVAAALRRLCHDKSHPLRFNLADRLAVLQQPSPDLLWELIDVFITNERRFSVLDALSMSLDRLWAGAPQEVRPRLQRIADLAVQSAPADSHIHQTLAHTQLFHFLRTGGPECETFVAELIADCDSERARHSCRNCMSAEKAAG